MSAYALNTLFGSDLLALHADYPVSGPTIISEL